MYTSETYIKMCYTPEIQEQWKRKDGDFALNIPYNKSTAVSYVVCGQTWGKDIWLPRQDQLQKMLSYKEPKDRDPHDWFCHGVPGYLWSDDLGYGEEEDKEIDYYRQFTSMEQLWLAFVMKNLHQKSWNGTEWVASC